MGLFEHSCAWSTNLPCQVWLIEQDPFNLLQSPEKHPVAPGQTGTVATTACLVQCSVSGRRSRLHFFVVSLPASEDSEAVRVGTGKSDPN